MSFDAIGFLQHYNIPHVTEGHKHCRPGWVQVECPFCIGNPGWHLGFHISSDWWNCWRCGYKKTWDVVLTLLNGHIHQAKEALHLFRGRPNERRRAEKKHRRMLELPEGLQPLTSRAREYLSTRGFNPDMLEAVWRIQSTPHYGRLAHRIFIPIMLNNVPVSWQCRSVVESVKMKYIAQSLEKEVVSNKDTLYGIDQTTGRQVVVVEGVTDVWRMGPGSVALFGIKYRPSQVSMLLRYFDEFNILFDCDMETAKKGEKPQSLVQAEKLADDLSVFGKRVKIWELDAGDPADLVQEEADAFMRDVLQRGGY